MIRAGSFRPAMSEISFGRSKQPGDSIGEFKIPLNDGRSISLNGRIDRLDVAQIDEAQRSPALREGQKVALVFDYKTSDVPFGWAKFFYGLDMQLGIYMLAVLKATESKQVAGQIAGAFYLPIRVNPKQITFDEIGKSDIKFDRKVVGIFNGEYFKALDSTAGAGWNDFYNFFVSTKGDQYGHYQKGSALRPADFEAFLTFCSQKIAEIVGQTVSGKITAAPYRLSGKSPCEQCDYMPVCRFDWQINDYNPLISFDKQQVLERIKK
jgi:ATP-dependent helicase/nuclease subunit B